MPGRDQPDVEALLRPGQHLRGTLHPPFLQRTALWGDPESDVPAPPPVLTGHVSSIPRTNWTRLVPPPRTNWTRLGGDAGVPATAPHVPEPVRPAESRRGRAVSQGLTAFVFHPASVGSVESLWGARCRSRRPLEPLTSQDPDAYDRRIKHYVESHCKVRRQLHAAAACCCCMLLLHAAAACVHQPLLSRKRCIVLRLRRARSRTPAGRGGAV